MTRIDISYFDIYGGVEMCKECEGCLSNEQREQLIKLGFTKKEVSKINYNEDDLRSILKIQ